jgi:hypothetical protein
MVSSSAVDARTVIEVERVLNEGYVISSHREPAGEHRFVVVLCPPAESAHHIPMRYEGRGVTFPEAFKAALTLSRAALIAA